MEVLLQILLNKQKVLRLGVKNNLVMKKNYLIVIVFIFFSIKGVSQKWISSSLLEATNDIEIKEIKRDNDNNIYVCGVFQGTIENIGEQITSREMQDIFIAKYNSSLQLSWIKQVGGPKNDFIPQMDVYNDTILLMGAFSDSIYFDESYSLKSIGTYDVFVSKLDVNGNFHGAEILFWESAFHYPQDIKILDSDNYLVSGFFYDDSVNIYNDTIIRARSGVWNAFYSKHSKSNNNTIWARFNDSNTNARYSNIAQYNSNIFLNGFFTDSLYFDIENIKSKNNSRDLFLYSMNQDGNGQWLRRTYGSSNDATATMDYDSYGNLYFGGYYRSDDLVTDSTESLVSQDTSRVRGYWDLFLMKYNKSGNLQWKKDYGSKGKEWTKSIEEQNDIIYIAGYYSDTLVFGSDTLTTDSIEDYGVLLGTFDSEGNMLEGLGVNGTGGDDVANAMTVDDQNNVYLAGYFDSESIQFGSDSYTNPNPGTKIAFIAKYAPPFNVTFSEKQNVSCPGGSDGQLTVTPYFGVPPYSFEWDHDAGLADSTATGLSAGEYTVTVRDSRDSTDVLTTTIPQPDPVVFDGIIQVGGTETDSLTCYADGNGTISISPAGGAQPYDYAWTSPDGNGIVLTDEDQSGLSKGTYNVELTDDNGCIADTSFTIHAPKPVSFEGTQVTNIGTFQPVGAIDLSVSGGTGDTTNFTYSWDGPDPLLPADTVPDLDSLAIEGEYVVNVTDENACVFDTTVTVADSSELFIYFKDTDIQDVNCHGGSDGAAVISVLSAQGPLNYTWQDSLGNTISTGDSTISGLAAGQYFVTVEDVGAGQTLEDSVWIEQPTPISLSFTGATTDTLTCYGDSDGIVDLEVSGGSSPYTYSWNTGSDLQDLTKRSQGTYSVTVTDANGCSKDTSWTIEQRSQIIPNVSIVNEPACYGELNGSLKANPEGGAGSPYSFQWNDPGNQTTATADGLDAGFYTVKVRDTMGCEVEAGIALTQPDSLSMNANIFDVDCYNANDGAIQLEVNGGTGPFAYFWTTGNGEGIVPTDKNQSQLAAGTYSVQLTDANECEKVRNFEVSEPASPISITSEESTNIQSCYGDNTGSIEVVAGGGTGTLTYMLTPDNTDNTTGQFNNLDAGTYQVEVTDENLCGPVISQEFTLSQPDELIIDSVSSTDVTEAGSEDGSIYVQASGGTPPLYYTLNPGSILQNQTGEFVDLTTGTYTVAVTDDNGCGPVNTNDITINAKTTGIYDLEDNYQFRMFPNPATDKISLSMSLKQMTDVRLEFINVLGKKVMERKIPSAGWQIEENVDISSLHKGMFFIKVYMNQEYKGRATLIVK